MHYRNGRPAQNGDVVLQLAMDSAKPLIVGTLSDAVPGSDYCNGWINVNASTREIACLCDCLHVDDVAALLKERGLDKRPPGK